MKWLLVLSFSIVGSLSQPVFADAFAEESSTLHKAKTTLLDAVNSKEFKMMVDAGLQTQKALPSQKTNLDGVYHAINAFRSRYSFTLNRIESHLALYAIDQFNVVDEKLVTPLLNPWAKKPSEVFLNFDWAEAHLNLLFNPEFYFGLRDMDNRLIPEAAVELTRRAVIDLVEKSEESLVDRYLINNIPYICRELNLNSH